MSNILNSEDFGLKIYNRFPPKYREDDALQSHALKRYLESLADGGFKYAIDEINGITNLIDPNNTDSKALFLLFKQYGLEVFNGIPEQYLRYLLPKLGEAWSKKGSLSVIEFITASLTGIKTSTSVSYDEQENPTVDIRLEMDYNLDGYFPDTKQFSRLLKNFIPFYCDILLLYSYMFYESQILRGKDEDFLFDIQDTIEESTRFKPYIGDSSSVFGNAVLGETLFADYNNVDTFTDIITEISSDSTCFKEITEIESFTNRQQNTLNGNFITNSFYCSNKVIIGDKIEYIY